MLKVHTNETANINFSFHSLHTITNTVRISYFAKWQANANNITEKISQTFRMQNCHIRNRKIILLNCTFGQQKVVSANKKQIAIGLVLNL